MNNDDILNALRTGEYKTVEINSSNKQYLDKLASFINNQMEPNIDSFRIIFDLVKFYRLPITFCLSKIYDKLLSEQVQKHSELKDLLMQIGSFVKSLSKKLNIQKLDNLNYFMKFGVAKKSFSIKIWEPQEQFANIIKSIDNFGEQLQKMYKKKESYTNIKIKIDQLVNMQTDKRTYFENYAIFMSIKKFQALISKIQEDYNNQDNNYQEQTKYQESVLKKIASSSVKSKRIEISQAKSSQIQPSHVYKQESSDKAQDNNQIQAEYLCCRTFFYPEQVIQQPESLQIQYKYYSFPFYDKQNEIPTKRQKIKKTLCGFLNAQGGIIYFGIKQLISTRKRIAQGMYLTQRKKKQLTNEIMELSKSIIPDISKQIIIKFVPIKQRIGYYIVKVITQRGSKDHLYSYQQNITIYNNNIPKDRIVQRFPFKTENQVLLISQAQQLLKIFKNKLSQPEKKYYPLHDYPCKQPEKAKFCYEEGSDDQYEPIQKQDRYMMKRQAPYSEKTEKKKIIYEQKDTNEVLYGPLQEQKFKQMLKSAKIDQNQAITIHEDPRYHYIQFNNPRQIQKLNLMPGTYLKVYNRISYDKCEQQIMIDIINNFKKQFKDGGLTRQRDYDKVLMFTNGLYAARFYVKIRQIIPNIEFTRRG